MFLTGGRRPEAEVTDFRPDVRNVLETDMLGLGPGRQLPTRVGYSGAASTGNCQLRNREESPQTAAPVFHSTETGVAINEIGSIGRT